MWINVIGLGMLAVGAKIGNGILLGLGFVLLMNEGWTV